MQSDQSKSTLSSGRFKSPQGILTIVILLALAATGIFLFEGLTTGNFEFNFPRRLGKIWAMYLVSICIGYSSVVFQTITENRILTPSVLGLDKLYLFIQTAVVFLFGAQKLILMQGNQEFLLSSVIMIGASLLIFRTIFTGEGRNVYVLVLVGIVLGEFFSGLSSFMQVLIDPNEFAILQGKMFASFNVINVDLLLITTIAASIAALASLRDISKFDVLSLGKETAIGLGIHYNSLVSRTMLFIAVMVSVSTVLVGPITFLGILLASLSRQLLKTYRHTYLTAGAVWIGIFALVTGQFVVERLLNFNTNLSVILNFIGGTYFIFILLKESRK